MLLILRMNSDLGFEISDLGFERSDLGFRSDLGLHDMACFNTDQKKLLKD